MSIRQPASSRASFKVARPAGRGQLRNMSKEIENSVSLPIFGADAEDAWLFTEEKLSEMRAAAHKSATDAVARFLKSVENESSDSVAPSPGKKAKKELDLITLAEDLMLQVLKLSLIYLIFQF